MSKTIKICLFIIVSMFAIVLIVEVLFPTDSSTLAPRSERIASICFDSCKWDSAHQAWKPDWVSEYFLTRSSCIDWCQRINE